MSFYVINYNGRRYFSWGDTYEEAEAKVIEHNRSTEQPQEPEEN